MNELQKESVLYIHLQGLHSLYLTGYYASSSVSYIYVISDVTVYVKATNNTLVSRFGSKHDTSLTMLSTKSKMQSKSKEVLI